jgi:hypothetical protein
MDPLAHGLWGGAAFGQSSRRAWKWAFVLGMAPDIISFGPFFLLHIGNLGDIWAHQHHGNPDPGFVPAYVLQTYNVTHSLITWAVLMTLAILIFRRQAWPMAAWGLHILCDIFSHSIHFSPTPYLWPFHTPFYDGTPWTSLRFTSENYMLIGLTYLLIVLHRKLKSRQTQHAAPNHL